MKYITKTSFTPKKTRVFTIKKTKTKKSHQQYN